MVVLRTPPRAPGVELTAANIERFAPDAGAIESAQAFFRERGFDVGPVVGISFAITAPLDRFRATFPDVETRQRRALDRPDAQEETLGLESLPDDVARGIEAVTFTAPPEFGPGNP
ncbi:MAG TPA: hypothetical protein VHN37_14750 [Actinomycetota bacterium]|nr:hypothetical protein [Actinomycetota bacterium]